ncbi:cell division protein ZapA [bacterium]|nr:cell division protein ZapA [FCB group bacterium]MBL7192042.1 cell division protein ZapA [bacterium]
MSQDEHKITVVHIMGQELPIKGDVDPVYLNRIARELDNRLRAMESRMTLKTSGKTAVLTALNLMDELETLKSSSMEAVNNLNHRIIANIAKINKALEQYNPPPK